MNKKVILVISVIVNIILGIVFIALLTKVYSELSFEYVEQETIEPDSIRMYLERDEYGVAASLSHFIRGGAEIEDKYKDYYILGEYTDLLFQKEIFERSGNKTMTEKCETRMEEIRKEMSMYKDMLGKMDESVAKVIRE